jgi:hypothetical protein
VSHSKIRSEKICLNCGTETTGRYCPACGQENIEPKQTVWHLITHFFSDITHFDGKFFLTVKDLFAKPGFLSKEYMQGRRVSYLDPIRMYIFTSAIFFLIFFSMFNVKNIHFGDQTKTEIQKDSLLHVLLSKAKSSQDSLVIINTQKAIIHSNFNVTEDSSKSPGDLNFTVNQSEFPTAAAYDSAQKAQPADRRANWLKRRIALKTIELNQRYKNDRSGLFRELLGDYIHNFPKVLFVSLPLFALLLKLLYVRRRQFYYVDHGIFAIHLYIFSFLMLLILFGIGELKTFTGWSWVNWVIGLLCVYTFIYYYKAMRRFYNQGRAKTVFKYILLFLFSSVVQFTIFIAAMIFTVFEV